MKNDIDIATNRYISKVCCKSYICDLMKGRIAKNALSRISTMKLIKSCFMDLLGGKYILSAENP